MAHSAISHCLLLWLCFSHVSVWHVPLGNGDLTRPCSGRLLPNGARGVHPSRRAPQCSHMQVQPPGRLGPLTFVPTRALPRLHSRCNSHWSDYVAWTAACVQVGRSVAIDYPCLVQPVPSAGSRMLEVQVHYMQLHAITW